MGAALEHSGGSCSIGASSLDACSGPHTRARSASSGTNSVERTHCPETRRAQRRLQDIVGGELGAAWRHFLHLVYSVSWVRKLGPGLAGGGRGHHHGHHRPDPRRNGPGNPHHSRRGPDRATVILRPVCLARPFWRNYRSPAADPGPGKPARDRQREKPVRGPDKSGGGRAGDNGQPDELPDRKRNQAGRG